MRLQASAGRCSNFRSRSVRDGTDSLNKTIEARADKKPCPEDKQVAARLAEKQKDSIDRVMKAIDLVSADEASEAFLHVLKALRADMKRVQARLAIGDVGPDVRTLEMDLIETLEECISALKPG